MLFKMSKKILKHIYSEFVFLSPPNFFFTKVKSWLEMKHKSSGSSERLPRDHSHTSATSRILWKSRQGKADRTKDSSSTRIPLDSARLIFRHSYSTTVMFSLFFLMYLSRWDLLQLKVLEWLVVSSKNWLPGSWLDSKHLCGSLKSYLQHSFWSSFLEEMFR